MVTEHRQSTRKVLKVPAIVVLDGDKPLRVRTLNISSSGLGIVTPSMLPVGKKGQIHFIVYLGGKKLELSAAIRVVYCVFSDQEFKAGVQFVSMSKAVADAILRLGQS